MMQVGRSNIAATTEGRVGKSPGDKRAESGPDATRSSLMSLEEITTNTYYFSRLNEINSRKHVMEMEIVKHHKLMIDILQEEVDDFKNRVKNDTRINGSRPCILEECARFERDLQQPLYTSLTISEQHNCEANKPKVSDPHEANSVANRDKHVYTQAGQVSGRMPVKSLEAHEQVQTMQESQRESCTAQNNVPMANSQAENFRPKANIYSQQVRIPCDDTIAYRQQDISMPHDDTIANSQQEVGMPHDDSIDCSQQTNRSVLDVSYSSGHEPAAERADTSTGRSAVKLGGAAAAVDDDCLQRHITRKDRSSRADGNCIDLLLFGNRGHGKSSTRNSILNKPVFQRTASSSVASTSSASSIKMESTNIAGEVVNVIDGPSISVSRNTSISAVELGNIIENIRHSLKLYECSFTALLIILKFGIPFPKHEIQALQVIKTVLGKNVIRDYGVCIISCGDIFDRVAKESRQAGDEMTFESWLKTQTGEVGTLFEECSFRCVLFDNWTKDDHKRQAQLDKLMDILPKGKRYSKDAFLPARQGSQGLDMEASLPTFLKEAQTETDTIRELIDQYEEIKMNDPEARNIKLKLRELKEKVNKMRISSVQLESLKMMLHVLESYLNMKLKR